MKKLVIVAVNMWVFIGAVGPIHAAEFFCPSGDVPCLIAAMNDANLNGEENTIDLAAGTYTLTSIDNSPTFSSRNGLPRVASAMVINGESTETTIIERDPDAPIFRIFDVATSGRLTLNGLTVRGGGGFGTAFSGSGAGINNDGTLTITDSIIERNQGGFPGGGIANRGALTVLRSIVRENFGGFLAGGISNSGTATIMSSSITNNSVQGPGGGIANGDLGGGVGSMTIHNSTISDNGSDFVGGIDNPGVMIITNSTIANNRVIPLFGGNTGGISNSGVLHIANTTISGNVRTRPPFLVIGPSNILNSGILALQNTIVEQCSGPVSSLGNNIIGDPNDCDINLLSSDLTGDPGLAAFVDDGMPGRGHFPLNPGSQAIDAGNSDACPPTDQLGFSRVGICDIGSVEFQGKILVTVDVRPRSEANKINPNSANNINVAIFSGNGFDARTVDPNTIRFGATGTEAAPIHVGRRDVDGDGDRDVVARFVIQDRN